MIMGGDLGNCTHRISSSGGVDCPHLHVEVTSKSKYTQNNPALLSICDLDPDLRQEESPQ